MIFSELNLKVNTAAKVIPLYPDDSAVIQVYQYLPVEDKNSLINLALQNSKENGVYNLVKLDMYFNLYMVYLYTDLEFTVEEKDDPAMLYDILQSNGVFRTVKHAMNPEEYAYLHDNLFDTLTRKEKYSNTIASVLHDFIEELPANAEKAQEIVSKFNPEDFQAVLNFAKAANGNRPI